MKQGMDPDTVEAVARQFDQISEELQSAALELSAVVEGVDWQGPDREKYVADFNQLTKTNAVQIAENLKQLASLARANIAEQQQASAS